MKTALVVNDQGCSIFQPSYFAVRRYFLTKPASFR
jgi:hypothetical protein